MKAWFAPVFWYWPQEIDRAHEGRPLLAASKISREGPFLLALIWTAAIEIPQMVPILLLLVATELLATDVLGVVMARMM
jgi:hypothetical protein